MLGKHDTDGMERDDDAGLRRFAIYAADDHEAVCMGVGCTFDGRYAVDLKDDPHAPIVFESKSKLRAAVEQHATSEAAPRVWFSFEDSLGLKLPDERFNGIELSRGASEA